MMHNLSRSHIVVSTVLFTWFQGRIASHFFGERNFLRGEGADGYVIVPDIDIVTLIERMKD